MGGEKMARHSLILISLLLLFTGCRTITEYVPQETVKTDSIYISQVKWDSIYVQDSVYVREKGETIFVSKTKYKYIERYLHDTLWHERVDSIAVPYPVEKKLTKIQQWQMNLGKLLMGLISVFGIGLIGWLIMRFLK